MADGRIIGIAKALKTAFDGATLSQSFSAHRTYLPEWEPKQLGEAKLTVVPKAQAQQKAASRVAVAYDAQVDVGIFRLAKFDDVDALDALMLFSDEVADFVRTSGPYGVGAWVATDTPAVYDPEKLARDGIFLALHTFSFRLIHT